MAKLVVATNENDILARTLRTGRYEMRGVKPTTSPSMDIQISSNFERLLFDANDRDPEAVRRAMSGLKQSGAFDIAEPALKAIRKEFRAGRASERQVKAMIRDVQALTGYVLDPHTAVGVHVAGQDGEASVADDHARNRASREVSGCRKTSLWY
jgi:threonine synthase